MKPAKIFFSLVFIVMILSCSGGGGGGGAAQAVEAGRAWSVTTTESPNFRSPPTARPRRDNNLPKRIPGVILMEILPNFGLKSPLKGKRSQAGSMLPNWEFQAPLETGKTSTVGQLVVPEISLWIFG